ncbi:MAG: VWA domain-containing protein, partial [Archangium sp.]
MNRTGIFLASAAILALVALVVGVPHFTSGGDGAEPIPTPPPRPSGNGSLSMTARLSHPFVAIGTQDVFATVDLRAIELPNQSRGAVNLALVIDRSGSMSGFKLNQAKQA